MQRIKSFIKRSMIFLVEVLPTGIQRRLRHSIPYLECLINSKYWEMKDGDSKLRIEYDLNPGSIVFDLGGYLGKWTEAIYNRYQCNIFVFEPCAEFARQIRNSLGHIHKIKICEFGLGERDEKQNLYMNKDSSSTHSGKGRHTEISIRKAADFFRNEKIDHIDLMKINIEGGEYELLEHLIDSDFVSRIDNLQIQFHYFIPDAWSRMAAIQDKLRKTHTPTYQYPFVWENWAINEKV